MKANVLTGKSMNMNKARQLALEGKTAEAAAEAVEQAGDYAAFMALGPLQQKAVADAAGMTVEQLQKAGELKKMSVALGGAEIKDMKDLTAEQIDKLKEEQANQNKTAEEIARDQLSVLKDISAQMEGQKSSIQMGIASTGAVQRVTNAVNEFRKTTMSEISEKVTTESTRDKLVSPALGTIEKGVIDAIVNKDLVSLATMLPELITNLTTAAQNIGTGTVDIMQNLLSKTGKNVTKEYGGVSGVKPGETNFTDYVVSQLENIKNEIQGKKTEPEKKQVDLNANYTVDIKGNASNLTNEEMKKIVEDKLKEIMTDPKLMNEFSASQTTATNSSGMGN
jgi:hypothetical protein